MGMARRQRWGLAVAVLTALGGLMVAGRLLDLPQDQRPPPRPSPSTTPAALVSVVTLPPTVIPDGLRRRPLRLPGLGPGRSCPATAVTGPRMTPAHPVAAVTVGTGPVVPVLFRADLDGRLDPSAVAYWDAPTPLGGPAIVRGHRLGAPRDRIRFLNDDQEPSAVLVLDPAAAHPAGQQGGRWWRATRLRAGAGCYGLQIDGPSFSEVLVVEFG
jgi:hypothetical protein